MTFFLALFLLCLVLPGRPQFFKPRYKGRHRYYKYNPSYQPRHAYIKRKRALDWVAEVA